MNKNNNPNLGMVLREAGWLENELFVTQEFKLLRIIFQKDIALAQVEVKLADDYLPAEFHFSEYELPAFMHQFSVVFGNGDMFEIVEKYFELAQPEFILPFDKHGGLESRNRWVLYGFPLYDPPKPLGSTDCPLVSSELGEETYWPFPQEVCRPLSFVAAEIFSALIHDKKEVPSAMPYLNAMLKIHRPETLVGQDDAESIIGYALTNLKGWNTVLGKRYRAELKLIADLLVSTG